MKVYRISQSKHAEDLKGTGAFMVGGRWNSRGKFMLYTSSSISLSMLENIAHFTKNSQPKNFSLVTIEIPDDTYKRYELDDLDSSWNKIPSSRFSRAFGDAWLDSMDSLAIQVPSVINPREFNILLNPLHSKFSKVKIVNVESWPFDVRLA
ncbi:MAG: RES family NAD+ phosphorylase [Marinifilum sp.]|jgi:RES domain-containing protein|nr:RES family NAD+ phosphorylase [Marinifilum sp.]